ncbi:MAG: hypothetical protein ABIO21_15405 [Pseudomonas sp.]
MTDKMRDEFEAAIAEEAGQPLVAIQLSRMAGSYSTSALIYAWWAWQASRAAVVVELLPRVTAEDCAAHLEIDEDVALDVSHMINGAIIACGGMIKAQGLKVKP